MPTFLLLARQECAYPIISLALAIFPVFQGHSHPPLQQALVEIKQSPTSLRRRSDTNDPSEAMVLCSLQL